MAQRVKKAQRGTFFFAALVFAFASLREISFLLKALPLTLVISHQHLVIEAVDFHRDRLDVL